MYQRTFYFDSISIYSLIDPQAYGVSDLTIYNVEKALQLVTKDSRYRFMRTGLSLRVGSGRTRVWSRARLI